MIEQIDEQSFGAIAEHAALKNLEPLKRACQNFGSQSAAIRDRVPVPRGVKHREYQLAAVGQNRCCDLA
jgi:hypothetical protein